RDGQVNYLHADHQGSIVARTDVYGTVTRGYLFSPFGEKSSQAWDAYPIIPLTGPAFFTIIFS
ncbi:MAG: hypothetical protein ACE5EI_10570, partial [Thermodesulfobacteriota bacterium]